MDATVDPTSGQFELNADQRAIQEMTRSFAADRVAPRRWNGTARSISRRMSSGKRDLSGSGASTSPRKSADQDSVVSTPS